MWKWFKRFLWFCLFTVIVAVAFVFVNARRHAAGPMVAAPEIVTVKRGPVRSVVNASGSIAANMEVDVKSKASGVVTTLPFDVSDVVKRGQLVMELDPQDEKRRVDQARAQQSSAEARWKNSQQTLKIAEETLLIDTRQAEISLRTADISAKDSRSKANRTRQLVADKLASVEEGETAETNALRAETAVEEAKMRLDALKIRPMSIQMSRNEVDLARTSFETASRDLEEAEQRLRETRVLAPIDGVVTTRPAQIGSIVSSGITTVGGGTAVMTLSDFSRLFVLASVDEADIGRVTLEQKVVIRCDAFAEAKFEGKIARIDAKGQGQMGLVHFPVKIEIFGEGKEKLKPAMTADIEIIIAEQTSALRIQSEAVLRRDDGSRYVLVPEEGSTTQTAASTSAPATRAATTSAPATEPGKIATHERSITVGIDDGTWCEVLTGLAENDKVVIDRSGGSDWSKLKRDAMRGGD